MSVARSLVGFDEIEWRGEKFKLKKKYLNYDDYKNGYRMLADFEASHVKRAIVSINVPTRASSQKELRLMLKGMRFPGYGSVHKSEIVDEAGNRYVLNEFEIPANDERRTLLYRLENDGACQKVVDGILPDHMNDHVLGGVEAKVEAKVLRFYFNGVAYKEIGLSLESPGE